MFVFCEKSMRKENFMEEENLVLLDFDSIIFSYNSKLGMLYSIYKNTNSPISYSYLYKL